MKLSELTPCEPFVILTHDTSIKLTSETGTLDLMVKKGTEMVRYDWKGPDEDGMVEVAFVVPLGESQALFSGKVHEKLLYVDWDSYEE